MIHYVGSKILKSFYFTRFFYSSSFALAKSSKSSKIMTHLWEKTFKIYTVLLRETYTLTNTKLCHYENIWTDPFFHAECINEKDQLSFLTVLLRLLGKEIYHKIFAKGFEIKTKTKTYLLCISDNDNVSSTWWSCKWIISRFDRRWCFVKPWCLDTIHGYARRDWCYSSFYNGKCFDL